MSLSLIPNADKKHHEVWHPDSDLASFPCPSRIVLCAKPNGGKTTVVLNLLLKANPPYKKIFLMHPSLRATGDTETDDDDVDEYSEEVPEYKHVDFSPLYDFPNPKFFDNDCKKQDLLIDDIELKTLTKEQKKRFNKILSYSSTHYNLTVVLTSQDIFTQLPVCALRFCNVFFLWRYSDLNYQRMILNRMGISKKTIEKVLDEMSGYGVHDFLTVDTTLDTPQKFRKNLYVPLKHLET